MKHLHEADADAERDCLAENRRLAERCETLEAALRSLVDSSLLYEYEWDDRHGFMISATCSYCGKYHHTEAEIKHDDDCIVLAARALLERRDDAG